MNSSPDDDFAEDRVIAVEEAGVGGADEELGIGGIRVGGARHAERAALEMLRIELVRDVRQLRAALAGPGRVAGLRHEAGDDAVEHDAVVELVSDQLLDLRDVSAARGRAGV